MAFIRSGFMYLSLVACGLNTHLCKRQKFTQRNGPSHIQRGKADARQVCLADKSSSRDDNVFHLDFNNLQKWHTLILFLYSELDDKKDWMSNITNNYLIVAHEETEMTDLCLFPRH